MHVTGIIPYRYWRNVKTGLKVSIHGACPYYSEADKTDWEIVTNGFTQVRDDGTVRGRHDTYRECQLNAATINARRIDDLKSHAERYPETAAICKARIREISLLPT